MAQQIKTALIVDDSRLARIALAKLLKVRGIEVEMAGSGTEALLYLRGNRPDVVFLDYMMPDMDGFEAARRMLADPAFGRPPIVMYTSQDTDEDRVKARDLGIRGFLGKPAGDGPLDAVLASLTDGLPAPALQPTPPPTTGDAPPAPAARRHEDPEAARIAAREVAERVAQGYFEQLRQELADGITDALREAATTAEQRAASVARSTVAELIPVQKPIDPAALEERLLDAAADAAVAAASEAAHTLVPRLMAEAQRTTAAVAVEDDVDVAVAEVAARPRPALRQEPADDLRELVAEAVRAELALQLPALEARLQAAAGQEPRAAGSSVLKAVAAGVVAGFTAGAVAGLWF